VKKTRNDALFVEPGARRKIQHVDAVELVVLALFDQARDCIGHRGIRGLLQRRELRLRVGHASTL
jgi:hypothetical protein